MKKIILLFAVSIFFTACKSKEEKAEILAKQAMKGVIANYETYEPIETTIDSAFAPVMTPENYEFIAQIPNLTRSYAECQEAAKNAKITMDIFSDSEYSSHQETYKDAKEKYEKNSQRVAEIENMMRNFYSKVEKLSKEKPVFNGYKVHHKYRFVNDNDKKEIGEFLFLMDEDLTEVKAKLDLNDEVLKAMFEESKLSRISE